MLFRVFVLGLAIVAGLVATDGEAIANDCRLIGTRTHCFSPPPPEPFSQAQMDARQRDTIAQERAILAPLASGKNAQTCETALTNARNAGRQDLERAITRTCAP